MKKLKCERIIYLFILFALLRRLNIRDSKRMIINIQNSEFSLFALIFFPKHEQMLHIYVFFHNFH